MPHVEAIYVASERGQPMQSVIEVVAVAGQGLVGDRYQLNRGSFSRWPDAGRAVSLIEAEAIKDVLRETGIDLRDGRHRRNIVTRDIRLAELNGRTFRIGAATFRGARLCAPCGYLERLVGPGTFAALKGRGGLRAGIIDAGAFRVGDAIVGASTRLA
jgi:MOSC domain-containing protein YiiM